MVYVIIVNYIIFILMDINYLTYYYLHYYFTYYIHLYFTYYIHP